MTEEEITQIEIDILEALKEKDEVWIKDLCGREKWCYVSTFKKGKELEEMGVVKVVHEKKRNKIVRSENFESYFKHVIGGEEKSGVHTLRSVFEDTKI